MHGAIFQDLVLCFIQRFTSSSVVKIALGISEKIWTILSYPNLRKFEKQNGIWLSSFYMEKIYPWFFFICPICLSKRLFLFYAFLINDCGPNYRVWTNCFERNYLRTIPYPSRQSWEPGLGVNHIFLFLHTSSLKFGSTPLSKSLSHLSVLPSCAALAKSISETKWWCGINCWISYIISIYET